MEWIRVSDRKPDEFLDSECEVLILADDNQYVGYYTNYTTYWGAVYKDVWILQLPQDVDHVVTIPNVTHWAYLPYPAKP